MSLNRNYFFIVTFLILLVTILFAFGIVYEESSTASRAISFKGLFTEPVTDWPITQIFISHLFAFLYRLSQDIPWYSLVDYSVVILSLFLCFRVFISTNFMVFIIPFLVLCVDDFVLFSFTRTAMLSIMAGLLSLYLLIKQNNQKARFFHIKLGIYSLLCLYGFFNRPQAFAYVTALFFLFLVFYFLINRGEFKQMKRNLVYLIIPFILVGIFFSIYQSTIPASIKKSHELAPAFYNIHSSNYHESFEDLTRGDSLALALIKESYVNDLEVMNEEFVARITKTQPKKYLSVEKFTDIENVKKQIKKYAPFYLNYHFFDLLIFGIVMLLLLLNRSLPSKQKMLTVVFVILAIGSLFVITNIVKMEMRISSPAFLMIFLCTLILVNQNSFIKTKGVVFLISLISIYYFIPIAGKLNEISKEQSYRISKNLEFKDKLDHNYKNKTIVLSNSSQNILHRLPFQEYKDKGTFELQFFEGEAMVYQPTFQKSFIKYCGSLKVEDIFDTMFEEKNTTFYISSPKWKKLMIDYLEVHYNKLYVFKDFDTLSYNDGKTGDFILYKPIKVVSR